MPTVVKSIATANPPYTRSQADLAAFMARIEGCLNLYNKLDDMKLSCFRYHLGFMEGEKYFFLIDNDFLSESKLSLIANCPKERRRPSNKDVES
jgi:hypothetical protein